MSEETRRSITVRRTGTGQFVAANAHGAEVTFGAGGEGELTPVELLLAAIAGCTALDVEAITRRRAEPDTFTLLAAGDKIRDQEGNRLENIEVTFTVRFPDGEAGDTAREVLPEAVRRSHDQLCTVSRTVERATPVTPRLA